METKRWGHRRGPVSRCDEGDRGQSAVIVLVVTVAIGVALLGAMVDFGGIVQDRTRAQTAADAAALASLDSGISAAQELAAAHGAVLISWVRGPGWHEVTVVVRLGDSTATARASNAAEAVQFADPPSPVMKP